MATRHVTVKATKGGEEMNSPAAQEARRTGRAGASRFLSSEEVESTRQAPLDEPLLDAAAAAELLSVKPSWVYDAARSGSVPHIRIGRHVRFLRSDLEQWVLTRRIENRGRRRFVG